ncbi:MAG: response regulator [Verrucomicrobia bacterium]|nr:response regulator [Verrucomicrobiota bacterium]
MSLTKKMVLAFLLVTGVPLGVTFWTADRTIKEAQQQAGARLEESVAQAGRRMDEFVFDFIRVMRVLAADPDLRSAGLSGRREHLTRFAESFHYFAELMLVDPQGGVVASSYPPAEGGSLFSRYNISKDEFEQALHGPPGAIRISDCLNASESPGQAAAGAGDTGAADSLLVLTPVPDPDGCCVGVLAAEVTTRHLADLLRDLAQTAGNGASAYLLDKEGRVLMGTDSQTRRFAVHPDVAAGMLRQLLSGRDNPYLVYTDRLGCRRIAGYAALGNDRAARAGDWRLITLAPYDTVIAAATKSVDRVLASLVVTLLCAVGLGLGLARRLAQPILELTEGARIIAAGRFGARVGVSSHDEISVLAAAFNQMAETLESNLRALRSEVAVRTEAQDALRHANDDLEQRVQERTAQLTAEVAERKRAEEAMREREAQLDAFFDGSPVALALVDPGLRYLRVNRHLAEMNGLAMHECAGKRIRDIVPADVATAVEATFEQVFATDKPILDLELTVQDHRYPGERRWMRCSYFPVKGADGKVKAAGVRLVDTTERKRAEQALRDAKTAAEAANRAKSEFLANMSHEIRTPMNGVIGMAGLLLDTALTPEQRELTETIRTSAEALLTVINDILDFSKIEAGKLRFEALDFDLCRMVEDTLETLAIHAQGQGLELIGGIAPEVPTCLRGDPGRLRQVLTNLVGNAIKFTAAGEVAVRVTCEQEAAADALVRFEVQDTGIGISQDTQARLFQAFVQADGSMTRKFGGTGLGLAICRQLVEHMGGHIGVKSTPGQGSLFWFTARLVKQRVPAKYGDLRHGLIATRALVVFDNATGRELLCRQLAAWHLRADACRTAEEALGRLRRAVTGADPYRLMLLDLEISETDGLSLARAVKAEPELAATRLVLLTPFGKPPAADALRKAGIAAWRSKPVRQSTLLDCLTEVLDPHPAPHSAAAAPSGTPGEGGPAGRILVVEDNLVNQRVALAQLRKLGWSANAVGNGYEALAALERVPYEVVLLDCQMPEMDGYQTAAEIRRREGLGLLERTWIVALTAHAMVGDRERCLVAGMDDYLSKPLQIEKLRSALLRRNRPQPVAADNGR